MVGVIETAKKGVSTFDAILKLKKETEEKIQQLGNRSHYILKIMDSLYQRPIITAHKVMEITNLSLSTCYKILGEMEESHILKEITGNKRHKVYTFDQYIKLFY